MSNDQSKAEFTKILQEYIDEEIYIAEGVNDLDKEIEINHWYIAASDKKIKSLSLTEWKDFIERLIADRKQKLKQSGKNQKLIFYLWFSEPESLHFCLINAEHKKLPFECKTRIILLGEVLLSFRNSDYHDGIPLDELEEVTDEEEMKRLDKEEEERDKNFVLDIFQTVIDPNE